MNKFADHINDEDPQEIFQLLDILGQGSYGSVSKALHKQTGELYAIKILPATSSAEIATINNQIGILKQCNDDHIVKYYGSYYKDNNLWIVMEYCIAGSVTDIMQITKKKLNENQIASILESALRGLSYIHGRKKIHRDIKAANILLDQKGNAKLADFGVSASSMQTNAKFKTHIGSPYWMSPEILKYTEYDYKTDIWSLGVTAIELAEGQVPNGHIRPYMAMFAIKSNPVQSLKEPQIWSQQFNDFVKKCLNLDPAQRPQAKQLLEHQFIKKFSKGQRLLAELVLSSMQQIQQFRMNQSRNSSFAELILGEADQHDQNSIIEHKPQSAESDEQLQGSMIILQSHRSNQSSQQNGSVLVNDDSIIEYKQEKKGAGVLASYINEMKQMQNVEAKCAELLVEAINGYDAKLVQQLERVFQQFKQKVDNDVKSLKLLHQKNKNISSVNYVSKLLSSDTVKQFLFEPQPANECIECKQRQLRSSLSLKSRHKTQQAQQTYLNDRFVLKNSISTNEKDMAFSVQQRQDKKTQSKSFVIPNQNQLISAPFKKSYPVLYSQNVQCDMGSSGQSEINMQKSCPNKHNSSRMMIKKSQQMKTPELDVKDRQKLKQFVNDPDVMEYLQREFFVQQASTIHTKSSFQPTLACTGSKLSTEVLLREQRSTEKSMSKGKNKSFKNLKTKKTKPRLAN